LPGREGLLWDGVKLEIDRDNEAYAAIRAARSEAGKMGGRPKADESKKSKCFFEKAKKANEKGGKAVPTFRAYKRRSPTRYSFFPLPLQMA